MSGFGDYGGRYVPETLIPALDELELGWRNALADDAFLNYSLTTAAIVLFLALALYSAPLVVAVLITTFAGLIVTAALGLAMVGELNPISVHSRMPRAVMTSSSS